MKIQLHSAAGFIKEEAIHWIIIFLHLSGAVLSDHHVILRNSDCSTNYNLDLDYYEPINLEYHGSDVLHSDPCSIEFTKSSYKKYLCIYTEEVRLDCETTLEYHEGFVKRYINPEKRLKCTDRADKGEEWCASKFRDNIFVVIKKPPSETSDVIKLRIYVKDVPELSKPTSSSSPSFALLSLIIPGVIFVVVAISLCNRIRLRKLQATQRPQITYQTTQRRVNMPTGYQLAPHVNFQEQHLATPLVQGDYYVHPMQSGYPVTSLQSSVPVPSAPAQVPPAHNATAQTSPLAPPPSYESVVQGNTYDFRS